MTALNATASNRHPFLWPVMATMLVVGWSSGFVGIRFANEEASVFLLLFWRTLLSGLILLGRVANVVEIGEQRAPGM